MIIIHNISKVYSKTGWQKYEVKINDELICKFNHRAADGLAKCLAKASSAVYNKRRNAKMVSTSKGVMYYERVL